MCNAQRGLKKRKKRRKLLVRKDLFCVIFNHGGWFIELPRWLSGLEPVCQCGKLRSNPWVRKSLWRRKQQPSSVFLPGKTHGQRKTHGGLQPMGLKRVWHNLMTMTIIKGDNDSLTWKILPNGLKHLGRPTVYFQMVISKINHTAQHSKKCF